MSGEEHIWGLQPPKSITLHDTQVSKYSTVALLENVSGGNINEWSRWLKWNIFSRRSSKFDQIIQILELSHHLEKF